MADPVTLPSCPDCNGYGRHLIGGPCRSCEATGTMTKDGYIHALLARAERAEAEVERLTAHDGRDNTIYDDAAEYLVERDALNAEVARLRERLALSYMESGRVPDPRLATGPAVRVDELFGGKPGPFVAPPVRRLTQDEIDRALTGGAKA